MENMDSDVRLQVAYLWIDELLKNRKLKVAVLGSCYSRLPFMSEEYFNPDRRRYVDLGLIMYHSSYLSLVSAPINIDVSKYRTYDKSIQRSYDTWAAMEFDKSFLDKLEAYNPDYLFIDHFADSQCYVYKTSDGSFFTNNYFIRNTDIISDLNELVMLKQNDEEKMEKLSGCMDIFFDKIKKILPLDQCILVKGQQALYKNSLFTILCLRKKFAILQK